MGKKVLQERIDQARDRSSILQEEVFDAHITTLQDKVENGEMTDPDVLALTTLITMNPSLGHKMQDIITVFTSPGSDREAFRGSLRVAVDAFVTQALAVGANLGWKDKKYREVLWKLEQMQQASFRFCFGKPLLEYYATYTEMLRELSVIKQQFTDQKKKVSVGSALYNKIVAGEKVAIASLTGAGGKYADAYTAFTEISLFTESPGMMPIGARVAVVQEIAEQSLVDLYGETTLLADASVLVGGWVADASVVSSRLKATRVAEYDQLMDLVGLKKKATPVLQRKPVEDKVLAITFQSCGLSYIPARVIPVATNFREEFVTLSAEEEATLAGKPVPAPPPPPQPPPPLQIGFEVNANQDWEPVTISDLAALRAWQTASYDAVKGKIFDISSLVGNKAIAVDDQSCGVFIDKNGAVYLLTRQATPNLIGYGSLFIPQDAKAPVPLLWGTQEFGASLQLQSAHLDKTLTNDQQNAYTALSQKAPALWDPVVSEETVEEPDEREMHDELAGAPIVVHNPAQREAPRLSEGEEAPRTITEKPMSLAEAKALDPDEVPRGQVTIIDDARRPTYNFHDKQDEYPLSHKKKYIIIHGTGSKTADPAVARKLTLEDGSKTADYCLYIDRSGRVYCFFPPELGSGAAGGYAMVDGDALVNVTGIAVEFEGTEKATTIKTPSGKNVYEATEPTPAQIEGFTKVALPYLASKEFDELPIITSAQCVTSGEIDATTGLRKDVLSDQNVHYDTYSRSADILAQLGVQTARDRIGDKQVMIATITERIKILKEMMKKPDTDPYVIYRTEELKKLDPTLVTPSPAPPPPVVPREPISSLGLQKISAESDLNANALKLDAYKLKTVKDPEKASDLLTVEGPNTFRTEVINPIKQGTLDLAVVISLPITANKKEEVYRTIMTGFFNQGGIFDQLHTKNVSSSCKIFFMDSYNDGGEVGIHDAQKSDSQGPIEVRIYKKKEDNGDVKAFTVYKAYFQEMNTDLLKTVQGAIEKNKTKKNKTKKTTN